MKTETYAALLKDLQKLQKAIVASQIQAARTNPTLKARLERLHAEAEVGGRFDDFVATTARKSTVLFLLRTVFVRVLEDLGVLAVSSHKRIREDWGFSAFREVAPTLGKRAYFAFVFRDLVVDFPAIFAPAEDEFPLPDEDSCVDLWKLWHHPNREGQHYTWNGDGFDSRFLGDLYQDLDADIRKRYALLQTPRFVEEYILDHTLTPALAEFDPAALRAKGETFRLIDPTCGSGHFLIGAFHRLADYWRDKHGCTPWVACERALESVWGCDINPHAVNIAEFRLLLEVVTRTGIKELEKLATLKLNLQAMDSLIPWERAVDSQLNLFSGKDRLDAYATPRQRNENAAFLKRDFHAVVGNPPYIAPKDVQKRDDYRIFWPNSAAGKYSLASPFLERLITLALPGGYSGQITSNAFAKRDFGRNLIEKSFPKWNLTRVIDCSGVKNMPGHGTPTAMIFAKNSAPKQQKVLSIFSKRGDLKTISAEQSGSWLAIKNADAMAKTENPYVTIDFVENNFFHHHPWSFVGGESKIIKEILDGAKIKLEDVSESIGNLTKLIADELYFDPPPAVRRDNRCPSIVLLEGEYVWDWDASQGIKAIFPYEPGKQMPMDLTHEVAAFRHFWRTRGILWERRSRASKFAPLRTIPNAKFYEYPFYASNTLNGLGICFGFVSTHNHFVLNRGGKIFNRTAPLIKLNASTSLDGYLNLIGLLNSSCLEFWSKQMFFEKRRQGEDWETFFEYDSTKLQQAPIATRDREPRIALARALDAIAQQRATCLPAALLAAGAWSPDSLMADLAVAHQHYMAFTHRMVALQEELDWLTYGSYELTDPVPTVGPDQIEPLAPGHRPFEIVLARNDEEADEDEKSAWWSRHGHERVTEIPEKYSEAHQARLQQRIELIESDARIRFLETPAFKRRWQLVNWAEETKKAAESWLLERLEDLFAQATDSTPAGALAEPRPYRLEEISAAWSSDPRVVAVAGAWAGTGASIEISEVAEKLLRANALPDNPYRLYSEEGLRKLAEWKRVWALQDQEDAWEKAAEEAKANGQPAPRKRLVDPDDGSKEIESIPLPPKFEKTDFVRPEYFSIRGKLNVPRERFILFTELSPPRYGWNGWRDLERAVAQVQALELAKKDPINPLPAPTSDQPRRCGVTLGLWESLADVKRWQPSDYYSDLQPFASEACARPQGSGCPCPVLDAWKEQVLNATNLVKKAAGKRKPKTLEPEETRPEVPAVTLTERAWVVELFQEGKALDEAGVWSQHQTRIAARFTRATPAFLAEMSKFNQERLARVLDDLVASGDLEATGRGKKKRYKLVSRGLKLPL